MKNFSLKIAIFFFIAVAVLIGARYATLHSTATYVASDSVTLSSQKATSTPIAASIPSIPAVATTTPKKPAAPAVAAKPAQPFITATAYIVGNAATGEVYLSQDPTWVSPIASISKLFTTLVTYQNMQPNQIITITQPMLDVYSDAYGFTLGEQFTLGDIIPAMLIESNNNLAEGLAMTYGYSAFIAKMNALAVTLGLTKTHFQDASGLSDGNISDARDLFTFAQYLYKNQQPLLAITATPSYYIATSTDHGSHTVTSTDPFVGDPHLVGGKTGRTDAAGETMMTIFNYSVNGKTYPIAVIVLHSDEGERQIDSERLLFQAMAVIDKQNGIAPQTTD